MRMWIGAALVGLAYVYYICLFGWAIIYILFGDRWGWLFLLNSFAQYLFLLLPLLFVLALLAQERAVWLGAIAALALWGALFGRLYLPKLAQAPTGAPSLTVLSYNLLFRNTRADRVVAALRASGADLIAMQELNSHAAAAIRRDLAQDYPYQALDPHDDDSGMGVISRYPLQHLDVQLPGAWLGQPQALLIDFHGTPVRILNIHAMSPRFKLLEWTVRERERQARSIVDYAAAHPEPLIVLGDFNAGDLSTAYRILRQSGLRDAWREAGWGAGHTFPGVDTSGNLPRIAPGIPAPRWIVRIDYVLHSSHWQAMSSSLAPWDESSDHRPVMARLALRERGLEH
jgi:endonuclease/exonuclease/phosphatase (EEP) superfamily protein YafD